MTYGVYSESLDRAKLTGSNLINCKEWLTDGYVICSEKEIVSGLRVILHFHGWQKPHHFRFEHKYEFGFMSVEWCKTSYIWADKIILRYGERLKTDVR